eukprot:4136531-Pyramimonas_sp.AAC.1
MSQTQSQRPACFSYLEDAYHHPPALLWGHHPAGVRLAALCSSSNRARRGSPGGTFYLFPRGSQNSWGALDT